MGASPHTDVRRPLVVKRFLEAVQIIDDRLNGWMNACSFSYVALIVLRL